MNVEYWQIIVDLHEVHLLKYLNQQFTMFVFETKIMAILIVDCEKILSFVQIDQLRNTSHILKEDFTLQ